MRIPQQVTSRKGSCQHQSLRRGHTALDHRLLEPKIVQFGKVIK